MEDLPSLEPNAQWPSNAFSLPNNLRFQELSSILEPGKQPKMDKSVILGDAVRMVVQLRDEAQKLKESYDNLQEKVNELKAEKNEPEMRTKAKSRMTKPLSSS
ncbi:hypothetical protein HAX54_004726 [Datura stramonium]|uniref:Uncharacterized protein n=1 Tax=Datura stramonium TaxID=4076 RepID=A0ABS8T9S3_DATST|nr:hypothetical protein [Datura stramonium]